MSIWIGDLEIPMRQYLYVFQVLIAEGMFAVFLNRRRNFWLRLALSIAAYFAVSLLLPALIYPYFRHNLFIVFLASFPVLLLCFDSQLPELLFCYVAGITVQNLSYNMGLILCIALGVSPALTGGLLSQGLQLGAYIVVHVACFFLCAKHLQDKQRFGGRLLSLTITAMVVFLVIFILEGYLDYIDQPYFSVARIMFLVSDITVLLLLFWMSEKTGVEEENKLLQSLIAKEYRQYQTSRETMDLINLKCHDIRHFLALLRNGEPLSKEMIQELEDATATFGTILHTGNPALDIILTEKSLLCRQNNITFTHMIDATVLNDFAPEEIASVFGNLLDNAICHLQTVTDPEYRVISLSLKRCLGQAIIHVENHMETDILHWENGLPVTSTGDSSTHGYGLRSVRYIIQRHGGVMSVRVENRKFCVDLSVPEPATENA